MPRPEPDGDRIISDRRSWQRFCPLPALAPRQNSEPTHWPAWVRLGAVVAARALLAVIAGLLVWAVAPRVAGWQSTTVITGSMHPRLMVGDIAVSRPAQATDLRIGQVLLFDDPDHSGRLRVHRFVGVDDNGLLITRGDANPAADSTHIRTGAVRGIGTLRVPVIGTPLVWLQEGEWSTARPPSLSGPRHPGRDGPGTEAGARVGGRQSRPPSPDALPSAWSSSSEPAPVGRRTPP